MQLAVLAQYWWERMLNSQKIHNIIFHSDIIVASAALFTLISFIAVPIGRKIFPNAMLRGIARDAKFNSKWSDHWGSQVHSTISTWLAIYNLWINPSPCMLHDRLFGQSPQLAREVAFTIGYFFWDLVICIIDFKNYGPAFLIHAIICLSCFIMGLTPIMLGYAPVFLLYEASTIFLTGHWLLEKTNTPPKILLANDLLLVITFFSVRLVWGGWQSMRILADLYWKSNEIPKLAIVIIGAGIVCMSILNNFWFVKIVLSVKKALHKKIKKA
jgi:hypothetical protein